MTNLSYGIQIFFYIKYTCFEMPPIHSYQPPPPSPFVSYKMVTNYLSYLKQVTSSLNWHNERYTDLNTVHSFEYPQFSVWCQIGIQKIYYIPAHFPAQIHADCHARRIKIPYLTKSNMIPKMVMVHYWNMMTFLKYAFSSF